MKLNSEGYNVIKKHEGLKLKAYQDSVGIWTIGYGNITYEDGSKVKQGDVITQDRAECLFRYFADKFATKVDRLVKSNVNQNQFNALVSFAYNIGLGAFESSTLLKFVNANPNDGNIAKQFLRWNKAGGKEIKGLTNRRIEESALYFSK